MTGPVLKGRLERLRRRYGSRYRVERLAPERVPDLFEFFERSYRSSPPPIAAANASLEIISARWRWLNELCPSRPRDGLPAWVCLDAADRIVGHVACTPVEVVRGGSIHEFSWVRDVVVDPELRGLGLGPLLILTLTEAVPNVLLGGLNDAVYAMYLGLGFHDRGAVPLHVRPLHGARLLAATGRGRYAVLGPALTLATGLLRASARVPSGPAVREIERFEPRFDTWWTGLEPSLGIVIRRSAALMNWRYRQHPLHRYRCFEAGEDGRIRGYAVIRRGVSRALPAGFIVELLADPADDATVRRLLAAADAELGRDSGALAFLRASTSGSTFGRTLARFGYLSAPSSTRWMMSAPDDSWIRGAGTDWFLNGGDSDFDAL